jgi:hypothetical protein
MPANSSIINTAAIKEAVKSTKNLKTFLTNKDNAAILLSSSAARKSLIKELKNKGIDNRTLNEIYSILGKGVAACSKLITWENNAQNLTRTQLSR